MQHETTYAIKSPAFGIIAIFRNEMLAHVYARLLRGRVIAWRTPSALWQFDADD